MSKSEKRAKEAVVDDLVCPITMELPFDPVTAEDGHVYERDAIEKHFEGKGVRRVKSPMTNERMGTRLLAAPRTRNTIESLIESGFITGDLAETWMKKANEKKENEKLLKKAEQGDVEAMEEVCDNYYYGDEGFKKDHELAFSWAKKAHAAGSIRGTARMGYMLIKGRGVVRNCKQGTVYLGLAAGKGSALATYSLGLAFANGWFGLEVDKDEACCLLETATSDHCVHDLDDLSIQTAREKLDELKNR